MNVNCPYCGNEQEINHDDGYGLTEDELHQQDCWECDKTFVYETCISFSYSVKPADCLNGAKHDMRPVIHKPQLWPDWVRCSMCGVEYRGTGFVDVA